MNVKFNAALMSVALLTGSAFSSVANAFDGTINFTGAIRDTACTITSTPGDWDKDLGTVGSSTFKAVGDTASSATINIVLTSCPASASAASIKFDGSRDTINNNLLAITKTGGTEAQNVGIGLYEADATTLIPIGSDSVKQALSSTADTTFTYVAKYMATNIPVSNGPADGSVNFTVIYE